MSISPVEGLALGLGLGYVLLHIFPALDSIVFLVPGHTMTRPWQVLTAGFFEDAIANLVAGGAAMVGMGRLLQKAWGVEETLRFVLLTNVAQAILTWVCMIILYVLFRSEHFLFVRLP